MQRNLEIDPESDELTRVRGELTRTQSKLRGELTRAQSKLRYTERSLNEASAKLERVKGQRNTWRAIAKELIKNRKEAE